jgi:uncharacterized membrane protein
MDELLLEILHWTTRCIEIAGILIIVIGTVVATIEFLRRPALAPGEPSRFHRFRAGVGRSILLGLEFLVAADIINTVAIEPTLDSLVVLAGIVLIRTFLSLSLEVEIEGRWPWQPERPTEEPREGRKS